MSARRQGIDASDNPLGRRHRRSDPKGEIQPCQSPLHGWAHDAYEQEVSKGRTIPEFMDTRPRNTHACLLGGVSRRHDPPSPPSPETGWAALESRSRCSGLSGRGAATVKSRARWLASTVRGPACERLYKDGADPSGLRASRGPSAHATTSPLPIEHALGGSD